MTRSGKQGWFGLDFFTRRTGDRRRHSFRPLRGTVCLVGEILEDRRVLYNTYGGDAVWSFTNLSYSYSNLLDGWNSGATIQQMIGGVEEAMGIWASVTPLTFFEAPDSGPPVGDGDYDPIGLPFLRWGHHFIDGNMGLNVLAHGNPPGDGGISGDIHFDDGNSFSVAQVLETGTHEFGHALGLAHANGDVTGGVCPAPLPAIMDACAGSFSFGGLGGGFLFQDDINGIRSLYGAGLGYVLNLGGILHVWGTGGDDVISVNISGGNIFANSQGATQGNVSFNRSTAGVTAVNIHGQAGNDILRIEDNDANIPIFGFGDAGNDFFDVQFANRNFDRSSGDITFWGGIGTDTAWLYDQNDPDADTYTVTNSQVRRPSFGDDFRFHYDGALENLWLFAGGAQNTINVLSTSANAKLFLQNGGGADVVNIGQFNNLSQILGDIEINNSPNYTTININDGSNASPKFVTFDGDATFSSLVGAAPGDIFWRNNDTSIVTYTTGTANDFLSVLRTFKPLNLGSSGGNDQFYFGNVVNGMQSINTNVSISAANGQPNLAMSDSVNASPRVININDYNAGQFQQIAGLAPGTIFYTRAGSLNLQLGLGSDTLNINDDLFYDLSVFTGAGNDAVTLNGVDSWYLLFFNGSPIGVDLYDFRIDGQGGQDALTVNDAGRNAGNFHYSLTENNLFGERNGLLFDDERYDLDYFQFESLTVLANDFVNDVSVISTAPFPAGRQTSLLLNGGNDVVHVYPRANDGSPDIFSNIGIQGGGGSDAIYIDDSSSTTGATWHINNPFGAGTQNFSVAGGALIGTTGDLENVVLSGSQGDDTFLLDSYQNGSALSVIANAGNDAFEFTPNSRNVSANVTSIAYFGFDGGEGYDAFRVANDNNTSPWIYTRTADYLRMDRQAGSTYYLILNIPNVETVSATGGTQADQFFVRATPPGTILQFDGAGGNDSYFLGSTTMSTNDILGAVYTVNSDGTDSVSIDDRADTSGKTLHIDEYFVGATPGDNLFGPGGYLYYVNVSGAMTIKLGSGNDTVYAAPHPFTPLFIEGNGNSLADAGDFLGLAFAAAENPVFVPGDPGSGQYNFANLAPLVYFGMEEVAIDDVAPQIIASSYEDAPLSTVVYQFSEDVSHSLSIYYLELFNTTTGQQVPYSVIDMTYDVATQTARFSFPGYPSGALPAGNYAATIYGSLSDLFGNQLGNQSPLLFSVTAGSVPGDFDGDLDLDVDDIDALVLAIVQGGPVSYDLTGDAVVNVSDRDAWLALAGAANLPSGNPYRLGDANLDGVVDVTDFNRWNAHKFSAIARWSAGDFTANGFVDVSDFNLWNANKFTTAHGNEYLPNRAASAPNVESPAATMTAGECVTRGAASFLPQRDKHYAGAIFAQANRSTSVGTGAGTDVARPAQPWATAVDALWAAPA